MVAKTLDHNQEKEKNHFAEIIAKGDLLHGVSAIRVKSISKNIANNMVKKFRLSLVAEQLVRAREKKGPTLGIKQQGGQSGRSPDALLCEQLASCAGFIRTNMEFPRKKAWDLHKNMYKVKGNYFACGPRSCWWRKRSDSSDTCVASVVCWPVVRCFQLREREE